jgi:hypothetical protein
MGTGVDPSARDAGLPYLTEAVEALTGRKVVAFMSANHINPDVAAEVFVLDESVGREVASGDGMAVRHAASKIAVNSC